MSSENYNKKQLNALFNEKIVSQTPYERPMMSSFGMINSGIPHKGNLVQT